MRPDPGILARYTTATQQDQARRYVREGRVRSYRYDAETIIGKVQGEGVYRQTLRRQGDTWQGWCICPYTGPGWCKHLAAVVFGPDDIDERPIRCCAEAAADPARAMDWFDAAVRAAQPVNAFELLLGCYEGGVSPAWYDLLHRLCDHVAAMPPGIVRARHMLALLVSRWDHFESVYSTAAPLRYDLALFRPLLRLLAQDPIVAHHLDTLRLAYDLPPLTDSHTF
ncbi:MAG: hypothetical protein OHK0039_08290 [Bacteroidia bacterium]